MNIKLMKQMEEAERRYAAHSARREERQLHLKTLGHGGDWRKVDKPERILNRLNSLGMQDVASEAMAGFAMPAAYTQSLFAAIRTAVAEHTRNNLAKGERKAVLEFITDSDLFAPSIFSRRTLASIADTIIEVTSEWRWL